MALSYPLAFPSSQEPSQITIRARSVVGVSESPFTFEQQTQAMGGERLEADVVLPPLSRADAEDWIGWLLALNGQEGTFLMGDMVNTTARGTWAGSPLVNGAHSARAKSIAMDGFTAGATVKRGDWFQIGTGSSSRLYKVVQDATASGGGTLTLEIWPGLRAALSDNASLDITSPVGCWRLASNVREYSIGLARMYGLRFSAVEAL